MAMNDLDRQELIAKDLFKIRFLLKHNGHISASREATQSKQDIDGMETIIACYKKEMKPMLISHISRIMDHAMLLAKGKNA